MPSPTYFKQRKFMVTAVVQNLFHFPFYNLLFQAMRVQQVEFHALFTLLYAKKTNMCVVIQLSKNLSGLLDHLQMILKKKR